MIAIGIVKSYLKLEYTPNYRKKTHFRFLAQFNQYSLEIVAQIV